MTIRDNKVVFKINWIENRHNAVMLTLDSRSQEHLTHLNYTHLIAYIVSSSNNYSVISTQHVSPNSAARQIYLIWPIWIRPT